MPNVRLILTDASRNAWQGDVRITIYDDLDRIVFHQYKTYLQPVSFSGLSSAPRGPYRFHLKTKAFVPVTFIETIGAPSTNRTIPLLIDDGWADAHGHLIPFPSLDASGLESLAGLADEIDPVIVGTDFSMRAEGPWHAYYARLAAQKKVDRNHRRLACLLNLFRKMKHMRIDTESPSMTAWDFVHSIFRIDQDRFFAQVKPELEMDGILQRLEQSAIFARHKSGQHNIDHPEGFTKHAFTFKTDKVDPVGNLQLSFSSRKVDQKKVWVLDADIDEKTGLAHTVEEGIYHFLTRTKTNPYSVHQVLSTRGLTPPYPLPAIPL